MSAEDEENGSRWVTRLYSSCGLGLKVAESEGHFWRETRTLAGDMQIRATAVAINHSHTNIISHSYYKTVYVCVYARARVQYKNLQSSMKNLHFIKISMVATNKKG